MAYKNLLTYLTGSQITHVNYPSDVSGWDENRSTNYSGQCGRCSWSRYSTHLFTKEYDVKAITIYWYGFASVYGQYDGDAYSCCNLQALVDGVWYVISDAPYSYADLIGSIHAPNGTSRSTTLDEVEYEVDIKNCQGFKFSMWGNATCSDDCTNEQSYGRMYDFRVLAGPGGGSYCGII